MFYFVIAVILKREEMKMEMGTIDVVGDIDELNEFVTIYLRNIDGIEKTQTAIVLNEA